MLVGWVGGILLVFFFSGRMAQSDLWMGIFTSMLGWDSWASMRRACEVDWCLGISINQSISHLVLCCPERYTYYMLNITILDVVRWVMVLCFVIIITL